jgi:hypothetical protein
LQASSGDSFLNGYSYISFHIANTSIANINSSGLSPANTSTYNLGSSSYAWNTIYTVNAIIGSNYSGNANIEIGNISGSATSPYIDFHSGATATDYDCRLIALGGTGSTGGGSLYFGGSAFSPYINTNGSYLGDSTHYWNTLYCNTINCNAINSSSAITVTGGIISYTYNEASRMTPTDATGVIVYLGAYSGLTTITLSTANISAGKIIEFHNSTMNSCCFYSPNATIKIHYSTANIVTYAAGTTSATIAVNLISRVVRVGSQFDITIS